MQILKPGIQFNIKAAARAWPDGMPISNLEILQHYPRTAEYSLAVQQTIAKKVYEDLGFNTRYWAHKPWQELSHAVETSESLAVKVLEKIFTIMNPETVDAFLLGSTTNQRYTGSQACGALGAFNLSAPAYDLKAGCSTSLATLHLAYGLMFLGYKNILVSCAETMSKVIDPDNEKTWLGVADGAAGLWIEKTENGHFKVEKSFFSTDGAYVDAFTTRGILPPTPNELETAGYYLQGDETLLKELALSRYELMLKHLLPTEKDKAEITWIIPHQVNRNLIDGLIEKHGLQDSTLLWDADKMGNIGGASILFTLARAVEENLFNKPGKILLMSVGGGLSYAAQIISVMS